MSTAFPNGSLTSSSRASQANSPWSNSSANPPPYSDHDPNPTSSSTTGRPTAEIPHPSPQRGHYSDGNATLPRQNAAKSHSRNDSEIADPETFEDWDDDNFDEQDALREESSSSMPSDLRPPFHRPTDGKSGTPLLASGRKENGYAGDSLDGDAPPPLLRRKSTFKEIDPNEAANSATRRRYIYAAFFLVVSLISFTIQTETAVYIKKHLGWSKSYGML